MAFLHVVSSAYYFLQLVLVYVSWQYFFLHDFHAQQPFAPQCQDCVSEICLMEARSVQQSAAETDTQKFCFLHRKL